MGDAGARFEAELAQLRGHRGGGTLLAVRQLGMLVEVAAPLHHLGLQRGGGGLNFCRCALCAAASVGRASSSALVSRQEGRIGNPLKTVA